MNKTTACHLLALGTVLLWSTAYIGTKAAAASYGPGALAFLRVLTATVVLAAVAAAKRLPPPRRRDYPLFIASGLLGMALYFIFFTRGMADIGPTTSCIVTSTMPIMTALLAAVALKERLTAVGWLAIGAAFCGILLMTLWNGVMNVNMGIVWTFLAAVCFSNYNILQRKISQSYGSLTITAYTLVAATLLLSPFLPDAVRQVRAAPPTHTLIVILMGIFPSAVASLLWVKALSLAPKTSLVTNYMFLTPFATLLQELIIQKRGPDAGAVLGGLLILGSLALFVRAGRDKAQA